MKTLKYTFILFIIINIASHYFLKNKLAENSYTKESISYKIKNLKVTYPDFSEEDIKQLIAEDYGSRINYYVPLTETRPAVIEGKYVNYTKEGYRVIKNQKKYNKDNFNIFVFGGSTTFGTSVRDHETIASNINEILETNYKCNKEVAVYNYGTPGHFSSQETIRFQQLISKDRIANISIFIDGLNDFFRYDGTTFNSHAIKEQMQKLNERSIPYNYRNNFGDKFTQRIFQSPGELVEKFNFMSEYEYGELRASLINFLKNLPIYKLAEYKNGSFFKSRDVTSFQKTEFSKKKEEKSYNVMKRLINNHTNIKLIADHHNMKTLFVLQPVQIYNNNLKHSVWLPDYENNKSVYLEFVKYGYIYLKNNNFSRNYNHKNFLDLTDIQKNENRNLYVDPSHYDPYFSNKIAQNIVKKIIDSNFIGCEK